MKKLQKYYVPAGTPISIYFTVNDNNVGIDTITDNSIIVTWPMIGDSIFHITENDDILYMIKTTHVGVCERP